MKYLLSFLILTLSVFVSAQNLSVIEGYVFEKGNRGYINAVSVTVENSTTNQMVAEAMTNEDGFFAVEVPSNSNVRIFAVKDMFENQKLEVAIKEKKEFVQIEMGRTPGYSFEVTLAEKRESEDIIVDAIKGARIEVYNNTTKESVMDLKEHMSPDFQLNLKKGNHYTILVRKNGYLSKRMEAKVNVEGCILCFEGIGSVTPGVSDNLTDGNAFGVLLANVELEKIFEGKKMEIRNLLYETNKWYLNRAAKAELNKVITLMRDNPNLTLELGSHTDSRGKSEPNMILSQKRAKSAVDYLIDKGEIRKSRIVSRGYGEMVIKNKCLEGIKCSDIEHSINRRTELKITGITTMAEVKSLKKMKEDEQMELEILKLMDQDQIQAKDEEELKKIIEEEAKSRGNNDMPGLEVVEQPQKTNGAKVIIKQSKEALEDTNPLFTEFESIETHRTLDGRIYYMLPFDGKNEALEYYGKLNKNKYKGSFVAVFKNGSMMKIDQ